jgi:Kdo2-lipid IVA lauroyltransferase/acyltransferase
MNELFYRAAKFVPKLPRWLRQIIPVVVGSLAWGLARREREHVTANVSQVLGPSIGQSFVGRVRAQLIVRRIFCNCISNYLELFALSALTRREVVARLDVKGVEYLEEALSYGRGVVLFSAHLGPFEYLPSWFSAQGYEMVIPVEKVRDERMLRLMLELRRRNGVDFVPLDGVKALRTMFNALRRNQIVLITADRAIKGESVVMDFFGAAARLPRGPVDLSVRTGAPLVGAFGWRSAGGRVACEFTPLTLALADHQRDNPEVLQAALTRQLERIVGEHVDEWVIFEPIWADSDSLA